MVAPSPPAHAAGRSAPQVKSDLPTKGVSRPWQHGEVLTCKDIQSAWRARGPHVFVGIVLVQRSRCINTAATRRGVQLIDP
jgi:hypothetical protein